MKRGALNSNDLLALFGWLALLDGLRVINEKDPGLRRRELGDVALTRYIARRRDILLHHHCPGWTPR